MRFESRQLQSRPRLLLAYGRGQRDTSGYGSATVYSEEGGDLFHSTDELTCTHVKIGDQGLPV